MTQKERILAHMKQWKRRGITPLDAAHFLGVLKLSTRIGELRKDGIRIEQKMVDVVNRYGETSRVCRYWLK